MSWKWTDFCKVFLEVVAIKTLTLTFTTSQKEAYEIRTKLQDPALLSPDTMVMVALENLKLLNDALSVLTTKARSYASYQDRFGSSLSNQKMKGYQE